MASLSHFLTHYHEGLKSQLSHLEAKRLHVKQRLITGWVFIGLGAILLFLALVNTVLSQDQGLALALVAGAGVVGGVGYTQQATKKFHTLFKEEVIGHMVQYLGLSYRPKATISQRDFEHSGLFLQGIDRYEGDDLVEGNVGGVKVAWSDLHVEYLQRRSKGKTTRHTLFQGLFFKAPFPKKFHTRTWILPDRAQKVLGDFGTLLQRFSSRGKLMKMDHPAFERAFVVYGEDPIEVRYLLTPSFMERLVALQNAAGVPLHVSFVHGTLYVAFAYGKGSFEPSIFHSLGMFETLREHFEKLALLKSIVERLGLEEA